jgi:hypothetical protein
MRSGVIDATREAESRKKWRKRVALMNLKPWNLVDQVLMKASQGSAGDKTTYSLSDSSIPTSTYSHEFPASYGSTWIQRLPAIASDDT